MKLVDQARAALQTASGNFRLEIAESAQRLTCDISALDSLACAFTSFTLSSNIVANLTADQLKRLGEKLAARLTYLLEPIRPIEFDHEQSILQMRSSPPDRDEESTSYYELVARRDGTLSLCRYAKRPGDVRQAIPVNVTREVFFRLVGDFSAAVA
ncbi:MAG TPA: hypothetical protein VGG64_24670 [Pirellulales bacterium]|jgi:hypothetical protein